MEFWDSARSSVSNIFVVWLSTSELKVSEF